MKKWEKKRFSFCCFCINPIKYWGVWLKPENEPLTHLEYVRRHASMRTYSARNQDSKYNWFIDYKN
jgi:hypothetical protein